MGTAGLTAARVIELGFVLAMAGFTGTSPVLVGGVTPRCSAGTALGLVWVAGLGLVEATVLGLSAGTGGFVTEGELGFVVATVPGGAALGFAEATVLGLSAGAGAGFVAAGVLGFAGATALGLAAATALGVAGAAVVCLSVGGVLGFGGETVLGVAATVLLAFAAGTTTDFAPEIAPAEPAAPAISAPGFEALRYDASMLHPRPAGGFGPDVSWTSRTPSGKGCIGTLPAFLRRTTSVQSGIRLAPC
jgi:hypothetical protein